MKEVERKTYLSSVEASMFLRESALPLHMEHKIASAHEFNYEEQPACSLETRMQPHQEGMVTRRLKHVLLGLHPVYILQQRRPQKLVIIIIYDYGLWTNNTKSGHAHVKNCSGIVYC